MTKEHAYAYDAGYRDGSMNYELEHCPACKNVVDLQEALAENVKLRERVAELEELTDDKRYIPQEWYQFATTENKKLRELVAEIWPIAEYAGYEHELSRARELMRELGYEED